MFKKFLASALAVVMLAGMSVTAFAAEYGPATERFFSLKKGDLLFYSDFVILWQQVSSEQAGIDTPPLIDFDYSKLFAYLDDENQIIYDEMADEAKEVDFDNIKPGDRIVTRIVEMPLDGEQFSALQLDNELATDMVVVTNEEVKGWNLDILWDIEGNEDIIEDIYFQAIRSSGHPLNYVVIEFSDDVAEIDANDLVGRLVVYDRGNKDDGSTMQLNGEHFATVGYESIAYDDAGFDEITSGGAPVRDFTDAVKGDQLDLYFDGVGVFSTANIGDEGAKYLGFNMNPDYELLAQYPEADMEFINFPGMVKFNRYGAFELFKQENQFAYAVVDGEIVTLESIARNGKVVDGIDAGYSLVLSIKDFPESFILSDMELELTEAVEETEEAVDAEPAA